MFTLLLLGCPWVGPSTLEPLTDLDGDGVVGERDGGRDCDDTDPGIGDCDADRDGARSVAVGGPDCDDTRADVRPGAIEVCDGVDNDCDGLTDDADTAVEGRQPWFVDADQDGFGAGEAVLRCAAPPGSSAFAGDCDDSSAGVSPAAQETCDGVDRNCDGDPAAGARQEWFADGDGDGFGDPANLVADTCTRPAGQAVVTNAFDCDDTDANAHPADVATGDTTEICDGIDNDCDGLVDAADPGIDLSTATLGFPDADGDGFGDAGAAQANVCGAAAVVGGDCDDTDSEVHPGAGERCATAGDDDCDGLLGPNDPDNDGAFTWYRDADGDGRGVASDPAPVCDEAVGRSGYAPVDTDCNDADATVFAPIPWYPDADGDGYGFSDPVVMSCFQVHGHVRAVGDCDDTLAAVHPGAVEICDGIDNDCSGLVDVGAPGSVFGWPDLDGDGFGDAAAEPGTLCILDGFFATNGDDCDDTDEEIHPGAPEDCAPVDRNCSFTGQGVEDPTTDPALVPDIWYRDADLDGFGDPAGGVLAQCAPPPGFLRADDSQLDCDDSEPARYFSTYIANEPGATELDPRYVFSLAEMLGNPGRCRAAEAGDALTTTVELSDVQPFVIGASATIDDDETVVLHAPVASRAVVCMDPAASLTLDGRLVLERVDLVFGTPSADLLTCEPAPATARPFVLTGSIDTDLALASVLELDGVTVRDASLAEPLISSAGTDPVALLVRGSSFSGLDLQGGLVDFSSAGAAVDMAQTTLDAIVSGTGLLSVGGNHVAGGQLINTRLSAVTVSQSSIQGSLWAGIDRASFAAERLAVVDVEVAAPLLCVGGPGCSAVGLLGPVRIELVESDIDDVFEQPDPLDDGSRVPAVLASLDIDSHVVTEDTRIRTPYAPSATLVSLEASGAWSSRRDRIGPGVGGLVGDGGTHTMSGSTFLGGLSVDDPTGSIELHGGAVVGGALDVDTASLVLAGVVVDAAPTSTATPVQDGVNALYTLPDLDVTCPTGLDCAPLEPEPYVSWSPTLPLERWMPFPNHSHLACALAQPDPNLSFDGVCWGLDPNADGLPVAWLVAHGADPSCWDAGPALFDPVADVDGDGLVNAVEASLGTWPCIADTDGDFLPDGDDPDPLAP